MKEEGVIHKRFTISPLGARSRTTRAKPAARRRRLHRRRPSAAISATRRCLLNKWRTSAAIPISKFKKKKKHSFKSIFKFIFLKHLKVGGNGNQLSGWKLSPVVFYHYLTAQNTTWLSFQSDIYIITWFYNVHAVYQWYKYCIYE